MYAFRDCYTELKYIEIPANVKEIQRWAFLNCSNLETVQINGNADMIIRDEAFQGCGTGFYSDGLELYFPNITEKPASWPTFTDVNDKDIHWGEYAPAP